MEKKLHMKKSSKILLISIAMFILFGGLTFVFFIRNFTNSHTNSITYNEKSNANYTVCLKSNSYFENNCLDAKRTYVADIIDYINVNFSYLISSSSILTQDYSYNITGQVIATSKEDTSKVIYDKTQSLVENKIIKNNKGTSADINESLKINYGDYSNIITNFKKDYVLALDAKLILTMNINYKGVFNNNFDEISRTKKITIEIPLSEQTVSIITNTNNENNNKTIYKKIDNNQMIKLLLLTLIIINLIIIIIIIISIYKLKPYKKEYERKLEKILKEYDRAIVTIKKLPDIEGKNIVEIDNFEEMLDARDNLEKPILFFQSKKEDRSIFTIINEKEVYIYILQVEFGSNR